MRELPILMNGEMVRAILDGRKTQTRRPVNHQPKIMAGDWCYFTGRSAYAKDSWASESGMRKWLPQYSPFGVPGDQLYVREHWANKGWSSNGEHRRHVRYHADKSRRTVHFNSFAEMFEAGPKQNVVYPPGFNDLDQEDQRHVRFSLVSKWWEHQGSKPSIHMPKWASRITLEVERVWAERLQEINADGATAEGARLIGSAMPRGGNIRIEQFAKLWDSIYAKKSYGWNDNPWVFACEFKVLEVKGELK